MMPKAGDTAPDFSATTDTGETLDLKSLKGKNVVLFFYPKDDTPGCTIEACSFRDDFPEFGKLNAVILGVSKDSAKSHQKFKTKYKLPYTLLSDPEHVVADAYGVWGEKKFMGRTFMGMTRSTFVIGANGKILKVFEKVTPMGHGEEVAAVLR
ncbi:MAG: thioredoxin-dependent thiol peroxidase [Gemmatimonadaceae bacterium]